MSSIRRALIFGFLSWLVPFLVSVWLFPVRQSNRPLFESIMPVVVAMCAAIFLNLYFRKVERRFLAEGAFLGVLWFAMSILFDQPLFLFGPMKMPFGAYMADIGVAYLIFPAVCVPAGFLLETKITRTA
jgi:hypothetical protein